MRLADLLADTVRTLWAHKLRTLLTMFGIAWGIFAISLMVAAGEGLRVGQQKQAETMGKDLILVFMGRTSLQAGGLRAGRRVFFKDTDHVELAREATACRYVLPELATNPLPIRSAYNSGLLMVTGSVPPFADIRSLAVAQGRFYNWRETEQGDRVAFLGSDVYRQLFAGKPALGATISIGAFPYTVVGVMERKEQNSDYNGRDVGKIFVPLKAVVRDFPDPPPARPHTIDALLVVPRSLEEHDACLYQVRRGLARIHNFDPDDKEALPVWDTLKSAAAFRRMTDGMKVFLGAVGLVTLFLGGIGVMNVMLVAVRERTREIGVRKAVGATSRSIMWQFFVESLFIVLSSGGAGLGVSYGVCAVVNSFDMPPFFAGLLISWDAALAAFALLGLTAVLAALYPAGRAAAVDPIEALRYEAGG